AAAPPERVLPESTIFFFKLNDTKSFREAFRNSQYGQLWNDPGMKEFRDELVQKVDDLTKPLKEKIGVSLRELMELPQGSVSLAVMTRDDPYMPGAMTVLADAGDNTEKMAEVLSRSTKQAEEAGAQSAQETFNGLALHILQWPAPKDQEKDNEKGPKQPPP